MTTQVITANRYPTVEEADEVAQQAQIVSNPRTQSFVKNVIEQQLAELALSSIASQFPIKIVVQGMDDNIENVVDREIQKYISEQIIPHVTARLELDPITGVTPQQLPLLDLKLGYRNQLLSITGKISSQGVQGTVYRVDIFPDAQLINMDVFHHDFGIQKNIPGILKKSPIYDVYDWMDRNNLTTKLSTMLQPIGHLSATLHRLNAILNEQFNNINNEAYIDAIGYYLGSRMVDTGMSPFYPLLYGTFRAQDNQYMFEEALYPVPPGQNFPVEIVIMQPLNGTSADLSDQKWFIDANTGNIDYTKLMSMFAQVIFGLAIGQKAFHLINNDFHTGNLMYQEVENNKSLYYYDGMSYYRVPTFGKEFKMIDFGRASFILENTKFGGEIQQKVAEGWNTDSKSVDLMKFVAFFMEQMNLITPAIQYMDASTPGTTSSTEESNFFDFIAHVTTCRGENMLKDIEKCVLDQTIGDSVMENLAITFTSCFMDFVILHPLFFAEECPNGIPINNIQFLSQFKEEEHNVPSNALVYRI